jgi:hypothetical protein
MSRHTVDVSRCAPPPTPNSATSGRNSRARLADRTPYECSGMTPEVVKLDLDQRDEFRVVRRSVPRTDPQVVERSRLQYRLREAM